MELLALLPGPISSVTAARTRKHVDASVLVLNGLSSLLNTDAHALALMIAHLSKHPPELVLISLQELQSRNACSSCRTGHSRQSQPRVRASTTKRPRASAQMRKRACSTTCRHSSALEAA